jgi:peptidoglycan/xylan/chitin deacetylase (PgdA/CDA1 family)
MAGSQKGNEDCGGMMARKHHFLFVLFVGALMVHAQSAGTRTMALTFDDLPFAVPGDDDAPGKLAEVQRANARILKTLASHHAVAIGFVNEIKLNVGKERDARTAVLRQWLTAGMDLGNHTYSHPDLSKTETSNYEDDFVRGTVITAPEMKAAGKTERYFRYPYLDTGKDQTQKQSIIAFYTSHNFLNAPVTVQNQDWLFNVPYSEAVAKHNAAERKRVADAYLQHTSDILAHAELLSQESFGREIPQVMLLHLNRLNADHLDGVLALFESHGYKFVKVDEALRDPAYATADDYIGPDGLTWLERWQIALGKPIPSNEPKPPNWAQDSYRRITGQEP